MKRTLLPPAGLERLLLRALPGGTVGKSIAGDLREELAEHAARGGLLPRLRWALRAGTVALAYRIPSRERVLATADGAFRITLHAARALLGRPVSAVAAVVVLALGTGLATTMFSIVYGIGFRGLDLPDAQQLRTAWIVDPSGGERGLPLSAADLLAWRAAGVPLAGLSAYREATFNLSGDGAAPERRSGAFVTVEAFRVLGVEPALGRGFSDGDRAAASPVILLSDDLWRARFGASPDVLGETVRLDGVPATVVGVMPAAFRFPMNHDLWVALHVEPASAAGADVLGVASGNDPVGVVFGRIPDRQAAGGIERALEETLRRRRTEAGDAAPLRIRLEKLDETPMSLKVLLAGIMAAGLLVLAVACANVSGVLMAQAAARARDVGVRAALGAGRLRSAAPFVAEAFVLAVSGSAAGVVIASVGVGLFDATLAGSGKPYWMTLTVDLPVLLFVLGVVVGVTLLSAAAPVLLSLRSGPATLLARGGRGASGQMVVRAGRALVVIQVALSCALLVGTGLVVRSLVNLASVDFPFARHDVLTGRLEAAGAARPDSAARATFYGELLSRVAGLPGVEAAALSGGLPTSSAGAHQVRAQETEDMPPAELPRALWAAGTPGALAALGLPLVGGRDFTAADRDDAEPVAIVEREMATRLFRNLDPIGRRFQEVGPAGDGAWRTVVGVTEEAHLGGINQLDESIGYYVPLAQADPPWVAVVLRTRGELQPLGAELRRSVAALDPHLPVYDVRSMYDVATDEAWFFQAFGGLFAAFGAAALLMAAVGLYGVLSFSVARRVPEMGVRMALGAGAGRVGRMVLGEAAVQVAVGASAGLLLSLLAGDALRVVLFDVEPRDPLVYGAVLAAVVAVALLSAAAPALRASRLRPTEALAGFSA